ncbi:MAG: hypothetical protein K2X27_15275, partial [Candidatus Obscuribacterales bacterium]|nr:hypothetical protein [Candidatus Obscuribacterales bacterium]
MTTSFTARYPVSAIKNLRVFGTEQISPADWARREVAGLKAGDILLCFNPVNSQSPENRELELASLILVFNSSEAGAALGILLTNEQYLVASVETILRERAQASLNRSAFLAFSKVPFIGEITGEALKFMNGMQRWGAAGTRQNPTNGLPDPLVAFFACIGAPLPATPLLPLSSLGQALIAADYSPEIQDLSSKYAVMSNAEPEAVSPPSISSVTVIETPVSTEPAKPLAEIDTLLGTPQAKPPASDSSSLLLSELGKTLEASALDSSSVAPPAPKAGSSTNPTSDSGFISIRKRLEAR